MTIVHRVVWLIPRLLTATVLVVSGGYLLVYLYRWEWNRAVISGLFFLAAELTIIGMRASERLRRIEERLERLEVARTVATPSSDRAGQPPPFAWLDDAASGRTMGVFIPVLLGAGVIFSAVAYLVERVAAGVSAPRLDRRTAGLLALPDPLGAERAPRGDGEPAPSRRHARLAGPLRAVLALAASVLFVIGFIDWVADATQSRPEHTPTTGRTTAEIRVEQKGEPRSELFLVEALYISCRTVLPSNVVMTSLEPRPDGHLQMVLEPALGPLSRRRFFGCLEDATLDRVQAHVVESTSSSGVTSSG